MKTDPVLERFIQLHKAYNRPPSGGRGPKWQSQRASFLLAQLEMFVLAQVICRTYSPDIQHALCKARRDVMEELTKPDTGAPYIVKPYKPVSHIRWTDFQITPEVAGDASLTGRHVSNKNAEALRQAHRAQVQEVLRLVKGAM